MLAVVVSAPLVGLLLPEWLPGDLGTGSRTLQDPLVTAQLSDWSLLTFPSIVPPPCVDKGHEYHYSLHDKVNHDIGSGHTISHQISSLLTIVAVS